MEETLKAPFAALPSWLIDPFLTIGKTGISLGRLLAIVAILVLAWWLSKLAERGLRRLADRMAEDGEPGSSAGAYAFSRVARYAILVLAIIVGLTSLGIDLTSLAILGGAIGVGVGIGLQGFFGNLFAGLVILFERSVKIGDYLDLQSGVMGRVTEISMRYTRITTNDSMDILVPNSELTGGRVINWSYGEHVRRVRVPFGVAYGSDKDLVREAGIAAALSVPDTLTGPQRDPEVWLVGFGDSSLNFELLAWVPRQMLVRPGRTQARYLWALETELAKRGLQIPFPQRDLHLRSGSLRIESSGETRTARLEQD